MEELNVITPLNSAYFHLQSVMVMMIVWIIVMNLTVCRQVRPETAFSVRGGRGGVQLIFFKVTLMIISSSKHQETLHLDVSHNK